MPRTSLLLAVFIVTQTVKINARDEVWASVLVDPQNLAAFDGITGTCDSIVTCALQSHRTPYGIVCVQNGVYTLTSYQTSVSYDDPQGTVKCFTRLSNECYVKDEPKEPCHPTKCDGVQPNALVDGSKFAQCDPPFTDAPGFGCLYYVESSEGIAKMSWCKARRYCADTYGGDLAVITDPPNFPTTILAPGNTVWAGGKSRRWINQSVIPDSAWPDGGPTGNFEACVGVGNGEIFEANCNAAGYFICQREVI